jgi:hypothetical protein
LLEGSTGHSTYLSFPAEEFSASKKSLHIRIRENRFSTSRLSIDIDQQGFSLCGELSFKSTNPWPVTLRSPGIMGWYAWVPFMECYHGVVSFDHEISGRLSINGRNIDFSKGRGYIEKDWGKSFPSAWIWLQSNHFGEPDICITASVAIIPWIRRSFPGFIIGFFHKGSLYRFATYTGASIRQLEVTDDQVLWIVRDKRLLIEILAIRSQGAPLRAPTMVDMSRRISETLNATIRVRLFKLGKKGTKNLIFQGTGRHGGLEVVGDMTQLLKK